MELIYERMKGRIIEFSLFLFLALEQAISPPCLVVHLCHLRSRPNCCWLATSVFKCMVRNLRPISNEEAYAVWTVSLDRIFHCRIGAILDGK